ncbi:MAG: hypothetical protein AAB613_02520 [Patescibacteria group bacterium]
MVLNITTSDVPLTKTWLLEQLGKLETFQYEAEGGMHPHIHIADEDSNLGINFLFVVTDDYFSGGRDGTTFQQVVFENANVTYIVPNIPPEGVSGLLIYPSRDSRDGKFGDYRSEWTKGTWMDGLVALARSVTSRSFGLGSEESQRVSQLLDELASIAPQPAQVEVSA